MSYLAELYARFGGAWPVYAVVFVFGGMAAAGAWWLVGLSHARQQAIIDRADRSDREMGRLSSAVEQLQTGQADRERLGAIRIRLGQFLARGLGLRNRCQTDSQGSKLQEEANAWYSETRNYIRENLDVSFLARFEADRPSAFQPGGVPQERMGLWHGLNSRIETLESFVREITLP